MIYFIYSTPLLLREIFCAPFLPYQQQIAALSPVASTHIPINNIRPPGGDFYCLNGSHIKSDQKKPITSHVVIPILRAKSRYYWLLMEIVMRLLYCSAVIAGFLCSGIAQAGVAYANFQEAIQGITSAHANAFSQPNLYAPIITKTLLNNWSVAIVKTQDYANTLIAKPRGFGQNISTSNRTLIENSFKDIYRLNQDLTYSVSAFSNRPVSYYTDRIDELKSMQNSLRPGVLDIQDTKDIKNLLSAIAELLAKTFTRLKDYKI